MSSIYDPQSQRDPRWAGEELGTVSGATIGAYGCFITAAAMIWTHYDGALHTPHDVNEAMKAASLYQSGDLWPDGALHNLDGAVDVEGVWSYPTVPADLSKLTMDDTQERMLVLDFDHNPNDGIQIHAVRVFSWDGHTLIIDDPWYGTRDNFSLHYGTNAPLTIQKIVGYQIPGWVPPWKRPSAPADPCVDIKAQLATALGQLDTANKLTGEQQAELTNWHAWAGNMPK